MPLLLELIGASHGSSLATLLFPALLAFCSRELKSKVVIEVSAGPSPGRLPAPVRGAHPITACFALTQRLVSKDSHQSVNAAGQKAEIRSLPFLGPAVPWVRQQPPSDGQLSVFSSEELRTVTALNQNLNTFCVCLPVSCFLVTKMMTLQRGLLETQKIMYCNSIFLPPSPEVIQSLKC